MTALTCWLRGHTWWLTVRTGDVVCVRCWRTR
jgi:hypothetical protein